MPPAEAATSNGADPETGRATEPISVLIVASWFPSVDDPAVGRFVADQVEALAATGIATPRVVSFDPARLSGGSASRQKQAAAVLTASQAAIEAVEPLFLAPAWGVDRRLPVSRLSIPDGTTTAAGSQHAAIHRETVLRALADRLCETESPPPGIVHAHNVYPDGAAAIALADRLHWPIVVTEHSSFVARLVEEPAIRERYVATLERAHRVIAVSEMLASELRSSFPDHADRIVVIPNAVPLDRFRVGPAGERAVDELLFVGYRKPTKGIENLLRAVALARAARPTITLRLLGRSLDDVTETRWRALTQELDLTGAVRFEEAADRAGIADAMARADLFVHPSPRETFGVVAVEALGSGTPVVAADSGGVTEILGPDPDRVGAIVRPDDPMALAEAILSTLNRREAFDGPELRASVERRYGAEYVAERLLVAYREAKASFRSAGPTAADPSVARATARPRTQDPGGRTIVVALDREQAVRRLAPLPGPLRAELVLVTARGTGAGPDAGTAALDLARVVEIDLGGNPGKGVGRSAAGARRRRGRAARLFLDPLETARRFLGRGVGSTHWTDPATTALAALVGESDQGVDRNGIAEIVAVDGHDHVAVARLGPSGGARLFPGGLRRLADRWLGDHESSTENRP